MARGADASAVEWAWFIARVTVTLAILAAAAVSFPALRGAAPIVIAVVWVLGYNLAVARLLQRRQATLAYRLGITLDAITVLTAWWLAVRSPADGPASTHNDLWLAAVPMIIVGVLRLGQKPGAVFVLGWLGALVWLALNYRAPGSHSVELLPVRTVFLALIGALTIWKTARLNVERRTARTSQSQSDQIAEICRIAGSSLDLVDVIDRITPALKSIVPCERFGLVSIDCKNRTFKLVHAAGDDLPGMPDGFNGAIDPVSTGTLINQRKPLRIDLSRVANSTEYAKNYPETIMSSTRSMVMAPVVSGNTVIGALFARSSRPDVFTENHADILIRVADYVGGTLTNAELYARALQLASEREARLRLDLKNKELQQENLARTMFLSSVSHELRTPLTAVIAFTDLLRRNRHDNLVQEDIDMLNVVSRNGEHLRTLVDDLLDMSRFELGKAPLKRESFDLSELIGDVHTSVQPLLDAKHQSLVSETPDGESRIFADRQRLAQALSNLLSNACKYSEDGSAIEISLGTTDDGYQISVRDSGSGIPEREMSRLFQPFFRSAAHRASGIQGSGLGLFISKLLVEAHEGHISVVSAEGEGTTVTIRLPGHAGHPIKGAAGAADGQTVNA